MNNIQVSAVLQKELAEYSSDFEEALKESIGYDYNTSLLDYEKRINNALDLQYKASYLVSIISRMIHINKEKVRGGGCDINKHKKVNDDLQFWLDYYRNQVYTFTTRAKTLSDFVKVKQMASPDMLRVD